MDKEVLPIFLEEERLVCRVIIPHVVLDLLPVPFQGAGPWVESNHRVGVEVVALPVRAHKVLSRIPGSVIDCICLAIVGAGQPRSATAVFAALAGPAFLVLFDSLELP